MKIFLVGGFLGAGKTTLIASACRVLIGQGRRVAVVTNDQGKLQVDSLFMQSQGFVSEEVSNGCFCCHYNDFDEKILSLSRSMHPDIIFAESVGSCADLVATVLRPFERLRLQAESFEAGASGAPSLEETRRIGESGFREGGSIRLTVVVDARYVAALGAGMRLPFSEDVVYIFGKQIEEADSIVLTKLEQIKDTARVYSWIEANWPAKRILAVDGRNHLDADRWLAWLDEGTQQPAQSIDLDYEKYGHGERELAWLDQQIEIVDSGGIASDHLRCHAVLKLWLRFLMGFLTEHNATVAHAKIFVALVDLDKGAPLEFKLSLTAMDFAASVEDSLARQLPLFRCSRATIALNVRAHCSPELLASAAVAAEAAAKAEFAPVAAVTTLPEIAAYKSLEFRVAKTDAFKPGIPVPVHRIT